MAWVYWTFASVFSIVFYYFFSKRLFNENDNVDPRFYGGMLQTMVGLISLVPALINGWYFELNMISAAWLVVVAVTYTIGPSLYYTGLKYTGLSVTTTLDATGAIYAFILGVLILGESLTISKLFGMLLVLLAVVVVAGKSSTVKGFTKYEILLLISPLFYAIGSIADSTLIKYSNALTYLSLSFLVAGITMTMTNITRIKEVGIENLVDKSFLKIVFLNAIFVAIYGYASYRAYMAGGEVSAMYPMMQSESVIVPFMAIWLFKEKEHYTNKIIGAVLAFLGILFLSGGI